MKIEKDALDKRIEEEKDMIQEYVVTRYAAICYEKAIKEIDELIAEAHGRVSKLEELKNHIINIRYPYYV